MNRENWSSQSGDTASEATRTLEFFLQYFSIDLNDSGRDSQFKRNLESLRADFFGMVPPILFKFALTTVE